jgi:hypothetical protein
VNFEESIKRLLTSESSTSHLLALELMQSQWNWSLEDALKFLFLNLWELYGSSALDRWSYTIGALEIIFTLEINDENPYAVFNWDLFLILSLKVQDNIIHKDRYFVDTITRGESGRDIKALQKEAELLFNKALTHIVAHLKSN